MSHPIYNAKHTRGFSLVELSIVLVILGLLIGGVLSGQSLIRAAQLRAVSSEYIRWSTASQTFRDKYFALPGDMTNATAFWGTADGGDGLGSDCRDAETNDIRTCNGNGDGQIEPHPGFEYARYWQHLSSAGLIEGSYKGTGTPYVTTCDYQTPGCVFPGSRSGRGLWTMHRVAAADPYIYSYYHGKNGFLLAGDTVFLSSGGFNFKPEEAWNIDTKLDDGKPGTGFVTTSRVGWCDTSVSNDDTARQSATYRLNGTAVHCAIVFMNSP